MAVSRLGTRCSLDWTRERASSCGGWLWRRRGGIGSRALLLLDHCFGSLGTHRVWLDVLPANAGPSGL